MPKSTDLRKTSLPRFEIRSLIIIALLHRLLAKSYELTKLVLPIQNEDREVQCAIWVVVAIPHLMRKFLG
jgi:hypothetical protein